MTMNTIFESIPYKVKDNNPNGKYAIMVCITPCPYFPNKIVAGANSCEPCRFNGGGNDDATVRCSYRHFMQSEIKIQAYEEENRWWYYFFQAAGFNNYDAEYADYLRIDGASPEIAAEQARI